MCSSLRLLVDNSVRHHAVALKGEWKDTGDVLWGGKIPIETGYIKSSERGVKVRESHGGDQTRYIASIANSKDELELTFHTTDALSFERFDKPLAQQFGAKLGDVSLLANVDLEKHITLPELKFATPSQNPLEELRHEISKQNDPIFNEIWSALRCVKKSDKSSQDAWHLACAIKLKMNYFLSSDSKLYGQICSINDYLLRKKLVQIFMRPFELCERLRIEPLSDKEFEVFSSTLPRVL